MQRNFTFMAVPLQAILESSTDTGSPHSVHTTLPNKDFRQLSKAITFGSVVMCRDVSEVVDWLESWNSSLDT